MFTGHFYGHLEEDERVLFLDEARRVAPELVVVDAAISADREREEYQERILNDGTHWEVFKRYFAPDELAAELGGGETLFAGRWFVAVRSTAEGLTVRKSSYRSIRSLQRDNARCRACLEAGYPIESWPVRAPYHAQRAYLYGQAPGIVEGQERLPWRGRAGQTLRRWLRPRRRRAVPDVLLRLRHALLSRPRTLRPRRPHADTARAGSLSVLARLGARGAPPRADRPRRRPRACAGCSGSRR